MASAISSASAALCSTATKHRAKSNDVPGPRLVITRPLITTRWSLTTVALPS